VQSDPKRRVLTASGLLLNLEFRGYKMILQHIDDWDNPDGDDTVASTIETCTQDNVHRPMKNVRI
jgi:hypothetical protein